MKKLLFILFAVAMTAGITAQDRMTSKTVMSNQLPSTTQTYMTNHFGGLNSVNNAQQGSDSYKVKTQAGHALKFNTDGSLRKAKSSNTALPKTILNEYNNGISNYVNTNYSNWDLTEMDVDGSKMELEMKQGGRSVELEFNTRTGELMHTDMDK